jgi:ADP-heptose:LPS heptosyltransferase
MFVAFTDLMDAVLTVDTAALHIGGVLNKPTLGLFGLSDGSKRTSKYKSVEYIQGDAPCSPCNAIYGGPQCNEKWCIALAAIDPMVAAHKLLEVLSNERV